jgi:hypothetical protein
MLGKTAANEPGTQVVSVVCALYIIGYAGYCFGSNDYIRQARYLVYVIPLVLLASPLLERVPRLNTPAIVLFIAYVLFGCVSYLVGRTDTAIFINDFVIIALILLCFVPKLTVEPRHIRTVFILSAVYFFAAYFLTENREIRLLQMLEGGTGSALHGGYDSDAGGLIPPLYVVFFHSVGARLEFLVAMAMCLVGGKRIAIIAALIGIVFLVLLQRVSAFDKSRNRAIALCLTLAIVNLVGANLPLIVDHVYAELRPDAHVEHIMLGRYHIGQEIMRSLGNRSWSETLAGAGPGSANELAGLLTDGVLGQPHNDWLKILFDYGILGSAAITILMAMMFSSSKTAAAVGLSSAIIMLTDNVIMYLFYQFPIVLMIAFCAQVKASRSAKPNERQSPVLGTQRWRPGTRSSAGGAL